MDVASLIDHLSEHGDRLAAAADRAGWDAPVPGTEWNVRALVTHVGGVHRWAADIVDTRSATGATAAGQAVGSGPPDDELLEWYQNGHAALVQTLRDAPADLQCFT
ncbi:MAG TPA: maleylpyruvate isomerase N-terminal domain-containing protein, partial [Jatrophihabitans sp.]|nr:maleylpyruvate isomerase N-terminal domain-containing protein [Jatrophihabitans sp.]